jgi:hypothetical protein
MAWRRNALHALVNVSAMPLELDECGTRDSVNPLPGCWSMRHVSRWLPRWKIQRRSRRPPLAESRQDSNGKRRKRAEDPLMPAQVSI